jgi:general nucleoside transport system ATP-binding protein
VSHPGGIRENVTANGVKAPGGGAHPVVAMRDISKRFGSVQANDRISLDLWPGEIHAVLGENGAGKTTLMSILAGMYQPDAGEILIDGAPTRIDSPADALHKGIGTVYQHFTLVPNLSVIENVVLGANRGFILDLAGAQHNLEALLAEFGLNVSPQTEVRHLGLGQRQRVEIVKALSRGSRVLLLDEPTSVLTPAEVDGLLALLRRLRAQGVAVVLITHKLEEALAVSDRITILRMGQVAGAFESADLAGADPAAIERRVVALMFGGAPPSDLEAVAASTPVATEAALLSLRGVSARDARGAEALHDLSLDLHPGEVFGVAGVDGNGQKELGEVIAGQLPVTHGQVLLRGRDITNHGVAAAIDAGIGYVTDDRLHEGSVAAASVADNAVLKAIGRPPFSRGFWIDRKAIDAFANTLIRDYNVKTPSASTRIGMLSGGNIQKLLLGRELALHPSVLVCNKPTTGLDVKTARFIIQTLRQQANEGKVVLLISSELDELLDISDRIGVMYGGRLVGVLDRTEATAERLGRLMLGGGAPVGAPA